MKSALSLNSKVGILTTISTLSTIFRKISTILTFDVRYNIQTCEGFCNLFTILSILWITLSTEKGSLFIRNLFLLYHVEKYVMRMNN